MKQLNNITFSLHAKDECWLYLFSGLLITLGINLQNFSNNLVFNIKISHLKISYSIDFPEELLNSVTEYIENYALILLRKKPINELFKEQWQLIKFKQNLDLSALTLKIYRDSEPNSEASPKEIFDLHDNLGEILMEAIQLKS